MTADEDSQSPSPGLHPPVARGHWVRPSDAAPAEPRWGHAGGLQVGLHPLPGPRGLLRVYAPYLRHSTDRVVNFVAVEPIPSGTRARGYSELEPSLLDGAAGKRFWSADDPDDARPRAATDAAAGVVETIDGVEHLRVFVLAEPFENGADVYVRVTFRADQPHEVGLAAYRQPTSAPLDHCVLTATMGNFARLRNLHLADGTIDPAALWPGFTGDHFTPHARFGLDQLTRTVGGGATVWATPDELEPHTAVYADGTAQHWRYDGRRALQRWRVEAPDHRLEVLVNGRCTYWASTSVIPGGTSFENFEVVEPFRQGRELVFGVEPMEA